MNSVIQTRDGEWLMAYSPVGNVVHFTRDISEARRVDMSHKPSADWARKALKVAREVYRRADARII